MIPCDCICSDFVSEMCVKTLFSYAKENCMMCMGSGVCQGTKRVNVTIPAGELCLNC